MKYYEEKLNSQRKLYEEDNIVKENAAQLKDLEEQKITYKNGIDEMEKEIKKYEKSLKLTIDKIESLKHEIDQLKMFNSSLEQNINHYFKVS